MTLDPIRTRAELNQRIDKAIGPNDPTTTPTTNGHAWWNWTPADLRGIPAVGRNCGTSAIAETEPGWNLDEWPMPSDSY